jgi:hypothetical protein
MKNEIQCIISGKSKVRHGTTTQTTLNYLTRSQISSTLAKEDKHFKREETTRLKVFINSQNLWVSDIKLENL